MPLAEFIIGDEDRKRKLPQLVLLALIEGGKTVDELVSSSKNYKTTPVGSPDQIQHQTKSIWHSKPDVDAYVQERLNIPDTVWHLGDSNRKSFWYDFVTKEISKLRGNQSITDWNPEERTGIWRLTHLPVIESAEPGEEPTKSVVVEKVAEHLYHPLP